MAGSLEPIAPGVADEFGRVQAIAKVVLAVTDTRPAANVATRNFTLTDSRAASSQLVEQSAQAPARLPACGRRHENVPALRLRRMPASVASGSRAAGVTLLSATLGHDLVDQNPGGSEPAVATTATHGPNFPGIPFVRDLAALGSINRPPVVVTERHCVDNFDERSLT